MRKHTGNGSVKLLIVGIFISIFLVLLLTFGTIFCIYHDGNSEEQTVTEYDEDSIQSDKEDSSEGLSEQENNKTEIVESTLLASGLAIIGIAISIWAGLNIIQVLEKDKLLELEKQVTQYKHERYVTNKTLFLRSVQSEPNELNRYIYAKLSAYADEDDDEVTPEMYFELNQIEKMFQLAYKEQLLFERKLGNDFYNREIKRCEKLKKIIKRNVHDKKLFVEYLDIRIFEFYFYKGYTKQSKDDGEVEDCYKKVINGFQKIFPKLKKPKDITKEENHLDDNIYLTVYMLNTLGEAHSRIIDSYEEHKIVSAKMRKCAEQAKAYFETMDNLIKEVKSVPKDDMHRIFRETYYRNYAKALERIGTKIEEDKKCVFDKNGYVMQLYIKAADIEVCGISDIPRYKAFHTLLSFYNDVMKNYKIRELLNDRNFKLSLDKLGILNFSKEMLCYAEEAERRYPTKIIFVKFKACIIHDLIILSVYSGEYKIANKYFTYLKKLIKDIENRQRGLAELGINDDDDMMKMLNDDNAKMKQYIKVKEKKRCKV